ncbi:MAG: ThuA domain-containing protein [bacterium]
MKSSFSCFPQVNIKFLVACLLFAGVAVQAAPIKVLIVDGCNNHDWERSTKMMKDLLEPTKLFSISVDTVPSNTVEPAWVKWCPAFGDFDVVIQNYNNNSGGPAWPPAAKAAFEQFVRKGGGVFIMHAANNAFPEWEAYNRLIGLGWRQKDYGSAIMVNPDGTLRRIPAGQGNDTSHGKRTDRVIHRLGDHPIHAGLPRRWMTPLIEVYTYARGPAENMTVLSWAQDPETKTGWPIEWVVEDGKGRCYNSTFGHVWRGETDPVDIRCAGFQTILVRALQWLARQPVTWPVPSDFPTESATVLRPLPKQD